MGNLAARRGDLGAIAARLRPATAYDAVRFVLGLLLLVAAALKAQQLATEPVLGTGLLDSRWVLIAAVEFELFFGLWLLAGLLPRLTWAAAVGCFGLFACVSLAKALGGAASCGCFGRAEVNPWHTCTLDVASVLALLVWRPSGVHSSALLLSRAVLLRSAVVFLVWLSVGVPTGVAMGTYQPGVIHAQGSIVGQDQVVLLKPEEWLGKRLPLLEHIDVGDRLAKGRWLVVLYHRGCPNCRGLLDEWKTGSLGAMREAIGEARIAVVEVPERNAGHAELPPIRIGERWLCGKLRSSRDWFVKTPVILRLNDGKTEAVSFDERKAEP